MHCMKKRRLKSINEGQCDTKEFLEDDTGNCLLILKLFLFPERLKSRLRHAMLLKCH